MAIEQVDRIRTVVSVEGGQKYEGDIAKGAKALDNMAGAEERVATSAGVMSSALKAFAALGIGRELDKLTASAIKDAAIMERFGAQFEVLTGSAGKAKDRLAKLVEFAKVTPFDLPGVINADRMLQAFNMDLGGTEKTLRMFGDTAAAMGVPMEQVISNFAKLRAGLFDTRELAAIGITREALKALGIQFTKTGEVINRDDLMPAAMKLIQRFAGTMEKTSKTTEGKLVNLEDAFFQLKASIGQTLTPALKPAVDVLTKMITAVVRLDPALLRMAGITLVLGSGLAKLAAVAQGWLTLQRLNVIAANTNAIATGRTTAARVKETLSIEQQALALWEKDRVQMQELNYGPKIIAQLEAETVARHQAALAAREQAAAATQAAQATAAGVGGQTGSAAAGAIAGGGAVGMMGKLKSLTTKSAPFLKAAGKFALWFAAITEGMSIITALAAKMPEPEYLKPPRDWKTKTWKFMGTEFNNPFDMLPSAIIERQKLKPAALEEQKFWRAIGGNLETPGVLPPMLSAEKQSSRWESNLTTAEGMNASEAEQLRLIQGAVKWREEEIKRIDLSLQRSKDMGVAQAGIKTLEEQRKTAQLAIAELTGKTAIIQQKQEEARTAALQKQLALAKHQNDILELNADIAGLRNQKEEQNIPLIEKQIAGAWKYLALVNEIQKKLKDDPSEKAAQTARDLKIEELQTTRSIRQMEKEIADIAKEAEESRRKEFQWLVELEQERGEAFRARAEKERNLGVMQQESFLGNARGMRDLYGAKLSPEQDVWLAKEEVAARRAIYEAKVAGLTGSLREREIQREILYGAYRLNEALMEKQRLEERNARLLNEQRAALENIVGAYAPGAGATERGLEAKLGYLARYDRPGAGAMALQLWNKELEENARKLIYSQQLVESLAEALNQEMPMAQRKLVFGQLESLRENIAALFGERGELEDKIFRESAFLSGMQNWGQQAGQTFGQQFSDAFGEQLRRDNPWATLTSPELQQMAINAPGNMEWAMPSQASLDRLGYPGRGNRLGVPLGVMGGGTADALAAWSGFVGGLGGHAAESIAGVARSQVGQKAPIIFQIYANNRNEVISVFNRLLSEDLWLNETVAWNAGAEY